MSHSYTYEELGDPETKYELDLDAYRIMPYMVLLISESAVLHELSQPDSQ